MPNRILRDWTDSEAIESLTPQAEVFFIRLIMKVDDFGRYSANPKLVKSLLFPIRDGVRDTDISRWLAECEKSGLIRCYAAEAKRYLEIIKFGQKPRAEKSKFPSPPIACEQMLANVEQVHSSCNTDAPVSEDVFVSEDEVVTPSKPIDERFVRFWEIYPKKVGKGEAEKVFLKIKPSEDLLNRMINAVKLQKLTRGWIKDNGQFIPHPSTWLNGKRWEDDHTEALKPEDFSTWGIINK